MDTHQNVSLNDVDEESQNRTWIRQHRPSRKRRRTIGVQTGCEVALSDIVVFDAQEQNVPALMMDSSQLNLTETLVQETLIPDSFTLLIEIEFKVWMMTF